MSGTLWERLVLAGRIDGLILLGGLVAAMLATALLRSLYLQYATPAAITLRPWVPLPADLPGPPAAPYGAAALRRGYRRFMAGGMSSSILLHAALIGGALLLAAALSPDPGPPVIGPGDWIRPGPEVIPPPALVEGESGLQGQAVDLGPPPLSRAAIPIPVPDSRALPNATIPTQEELGSLNVANGSPTGSIWGSSVRPAGEGTWGPSGPESSVEAVFDANVVETPPRIVAMPEVEYPLLAREAQVEGVVLLTLLVGPNGRVQKVRIARSVPMLDEAARAAAAGAVFTPAMWRGRAVSVLIQLPIRFELRESSR